MKQTRAMSLVEAITNVAIGYGIAVATQMLIFPVFGLHATLAQNLKLGLAFTIVSIVRSFAIRRLFETIRTRRAERETAAPSGRRRQSPVVFRREFCKPDLDSQSFRR
jgi:cobalamin biosynthesis protein CobD/CbiB